MKKITWLLLFVLVVVVYLISKNTSPQVSFSSSQEDASHEASSRYSIEEIAPNIIFLRINDLQDRDNVIKEAIGEVSMKYKIINITSTSVYREGGTYHQDYYDSAFIITVETK